ncbi:MAG TPA: 30S ribosome-binding factor RbfA [Burkholderiales bacterium]|nr:30S ribosome-binding factor RbfA [Burkholderiales bacterium]
MQKVTNRPQRVAELLRRELAMLIPQAVRDPQVGAVTLTHAEVARDLSAAKIYFTLLDGEAKAKETERALNHAAGFLRHELRERVILRGIPRLRFYFDKSVERGSRLTSLIDRAVAADKKDDNGSE